MFKSILDRLSSKRSQLGRNKDPLVNEIHQMGNYLHSQLSVPGLGNSLKEFADTFFKKSDDEVKHGVAELYLRYEQYLTEIDPQINFTKQKLRKKVSKDFPQLVNLPGLDLVFMPLPKTKILLCRQFLEIVLQDVVNVLGQVQDNYFANALNWVKKLPAVEAPFPALPLAKVEESDLTDHLIDVSHQISETLERKMGSAFAQRIYDNGYNQIARSFKYLDGFPIIISLIPKKFLDTDKVGLLSKHQLAETLLDKVSYLEELNSQLADRNSALYRAQVEVKKAQKETVNALNQLGKSDERCKRWNPYS